ncbi:MAG TPA: helix-turn-helix transcriptional regulator [Virgibacillus sp.]|nr:helix-turn-helix transcriptional regulator [Virgibacillus sp.]
MAHTYPEVEEAILYIQKNICEPLSLSQLANHVSYSPYHFTRIFKSRTGLTPLYYVSSMRLQKAKDLLLNTDLTVRDIGLEIGQQSLGTFTTRFTEKVGITPSQFRKSHMQVDHHLHSLQKLSNWRDDPPPSHQNANIEGTIQTAHPFNGFILIGLFSKPIPEEFPLYGTLLSSTGDFSFTNVQPGTYYLMATSVSWEMQSMDILLPHTTLRTRSKKPIVVKPASIIPHQELTLHPPKLDDPPILVSLPSLMTRFLNRVREHSN